jgi:sugar transferase (PEP-CTERM/EpsH1 system associated)
MNKRPKKVLHILHSFSHGGLENGIVNIINGSTPDLEHELCLLTTAGDFINRLQKPIRYYELHKQPGNSLKTILQLRCVIRDSGADIVHTRNWGAFDGVLAACLCPGVTLLHGEHGRDFTDPHGLNCRRNKMRRLLSFRISKFTTVSIDLTKWLSDTVGIPKKKIILIRNGVDTARFTPRRDPELRKELGIAANEFVIGTVGRLDPVKNHADLIRAFAKLLDDTAARLVIVGDGPERENLEQLAEKTSVACASIFTGYRSDVERFYGVFDLFVLNSLAEGMSNTLLEAMACGIPVVCSRAGANPELISEERGFLLQKNSVVDLAQALEVAMNSLISRGHKNAIRNFVQEKHSLNSMVSEYVTLYRSIP